PSPRRRSGVFFRLRKQRAELADHNHEPLDDRRKQVELLALHMVASVLLDPELPYLLALDLDAGDRLERLPEDPRRTLEGLLGLLLKRHELLMDHLPGRVVRVLEGDDD